MFTYKRNMNVFFVMIDFIIFLLYYINYIYHVSPPLYFQMKYSVVSFTRCFCISIGKNTDGVMPSLVLCDCLFKNKTRMCRK